MSNVSNIHDCFGCGVCAAICGKNAISISLNAKGFYEPSIDLSKCVECGLCHKTCSVCHDDIALYASDSLFYSGWSNNSKIRKQSTSGGIAFEMASMLMKQGYTFCGVRYNNLKGIAEHYLTDNIDELQQSLGSKYIQSYTLDAFRQFKRDKKYVVVGTPCQIDSIRRFIRLRNIEQNFVLIDFFCHSVPSMHLWDYYKHMAEKCVGKINGVRWRSKSNDWDYSEGQDVEWHKSYNMLVKGERGQFHSSLSEHDIFHSCFLFNMSCSPACVEKCKFKQLNSSADIRIGDCWGTQYKENRDGVNSIITFTSLGKEIIDSLPNATIISMSKDDILLGQMKNRAHHAVLSPLSHFILKHKIRFSKSIWTTIIRIELRLNKIVK